MAEYLLHKLDQIIVWLQYFTLKNIEIILGVKFKTAAKFIWAGGRIGRSFKYVVFFTFVSTIFLAGGIFQSSFIEDTGTDQNQFLNSNSILLGEATAATTTGRTELLDEPTEHIVKDGETLNSIGQEYGISVETIRFANSLVYDRLNVGQSLLIPPVEGTIHTVKNGETISSIARRYNVSSQNIVDFNYLDAPYTLEEGMFITIPDADIPDTKRYYVGNDSYDTSAYGVIPYVEGGTKGTGRFQWPFSGIITQGFHRYHAAIDIAANTGNIVAADAGTVIRAGLWQGGYGNAVQVDHGNGYVTSYAHMSVITVSNGEKVEKGQKLGVVGSTGRSTGPHLHFSIQFEGKYLNPLELL